MFYVCEAIYNRIVRLSFCNITSHDLFTVGPINLWKRKTVKLMILDSETYSSCLENVSLYTEYTYKFQFIFEFKFTETSNKYTKDYCLLFIQQFYGSQLSLKGILRL